MSVALSDHATIQMPLLDFRKLENRIDQLNAELKKERAKTQSGTRQPSDEASWDLGAEAEKAFDSALEIVRWAVGNCPPESNRGWPVEPLRDLSVRLEALYPIEDADNADQRNLAQTFMTFANECDKIESIREQRLAEAVDIVRQAKDEDDSVDEPTKDDETALTS